MFNVNGFFTFFWGQQNVSFTLNLSSTLLVCSSRHLPVDSGRFHYLWAFHDIICDALKMSL